MSMSDRMALTPDLVARCWRAEADSGADPRMQVLSAEEREAFAHRLVSELGDQALWVFAYGSLIWKPVFETVERRRGTIHGWHRSFCLELINWRGTREQPGLMMALDRGGQCDGIVLRLPNGDRLTQIDRLLARELEYREDIRTTRWTNVRTREGSVRALLFYAGPIAAATVRKLPLEIVAARLARACGPGGSGAEYLYNTVLHLTEAGINDRNLWRLQELVAAEIRAIHSL